MPEWTEGGVEDEDAVGRRRTKREGGFTAEDDGRSSLYDETFLAEKGLEGCDDEGE